MGRPVRPAKPVGHNLPLSGAAMGMASSRIPHAKVVAKIARAFPSAQAIHRHDVLRWHAEHGGLVRLTARHFGLSPDTVSRWARAYAELGTRGLEGKSRRPKRVRQPSTPTAIVVRIRELRERYPRWGREKLRVLLLREGLDVSAKTIDRTIARLRARGDLKEPISVRKALRARARAALRPRRPGDLAVDRPGFLQIDSQELRLGPHVIFTFAAVDFFTRKRVVSASNRLTSAAGARFLARVQERLPFPVRAVQCDGGHEFRGEFEMAAAAAGIAQYINRPNYPQGNGRVERAFLTDDQEFHEVEDLARTAEGLDRQLAVWNQIYEEIRPHQSLGYLTPNQFYAKWVSEHPSATSPVSDMP